ncbi:MAG: Glu/Leu/Phe/Val dehydrogenase [Tissierellia bacterium]|nr:Glu/Leu/Phe/Val dehydrogenase [Tissierellia bacterium]
MIFDKMETGEFEQIVFCHDKTSGLRAIIAIHDTTLGPALGGCRIWNYNSEEEALIDAMRLAKGMTYKNAAAGLNIGGGKSVIIADPKKDKTEALLRAFGRYVESLNGRYITAADVGSGPEDLDIIYQETDYVVGISESHGSSGDPSPVTAFGVYRAMMRTAKEAFGDDSLEGKTVSVQGCGSVAYTLCKHLHEAGAKLIVTDIDKEAMERVVKDFGAETVEPDKIYEVEADIFAPCALGAILNDETIPKLKVKAICGSANNQLEDIEKHGKMLKDRGIVYAPDFIANAGGVINVADELEGYNRERALAKASTIYDQIGLVFDIAKEENITTAKAADRMAEERIAAMKEIRSNFIRTEHNILSRR